MSKKNLRVHYLQHVTFEGPANIYSWADMRGLQISRTLLSQHEPFPDLDDFDWLIIMGGPMSVSEEAEYPWLKEEKLFIKKAIDAGKIVFGICLGAQLIAHVLGGKVERGPHREIGWFKVHTNDNKAQHPLFKDWPKEFNAFHWHMDTFELPEGAVNFCSSEACDNQAFFFNDRVIAFQFHLEFCDHTIRRLINKHGDQMTESQYVQKEHELLDQDDLNLELRHRLFDFLDAMRDYFS